MGPTFFHSVSKNRTQPSASDPAEISQSLFIPQGIILIYHLSLSRLLYRDTTGMNIYSFVRVPRPEVIENGIELWESLFTVHLVGKRWRIKAHCCTDSFVARTASGNVHSGVDLPVYYIYQAIVQMLPVSEEKTNNNTVTTFLPHSEPTTLSSVFSLKCSYRLSLHVYFGHDFYIGCIHVKKHYFTMVIGF